MDAFTPIVLVPYAVAPSAMGNELSILRDCAQRLEGALVDRMRLKPGECEGDRLSILPATRLIEARMDRVARVLDAFSSDEGFFSSLRVRMLDVIGAFKRVSEETVLARVERLSGPRFGPEDFILHFPGEGTHVARGVMTFFGLHVDPFSFRIGRERFSTRVRREDGRAPSYALEGPFGCGVAASLLIYENPGELETICATNGYAQVAFVRTEKGIKLFSRK